MFVQHLHNSPSLQSLTVNQKFLGAAATLEFTSPLKLVANDRKRRLLLMGQSLGSSLFTD